MSYIKIRIRSRRTDEEGKMVKATIRNLETDRVVDTTDLPIILHALSDAGFGTERSKEFTLDDSVLDGEDYLA